MALSPSAPPLPTSISRSTSAPEVPGKDAEWVSWDHPLHGYVCPLTADGATGPDQVQEHAIDEVIAFLDRYMKPEG